VNSNLKEIMSVFFKLGVSAFGGPAAHIAMMEEELVEKRKWVDRQKYLDIIGATNLIPGPNSTEVAIHMGYIRGGWKGLLLGGASFILPAATITLILAWAYVKYGSLPAAEPILQGIQAVVIVFILGAFYKLSKKAIKDVPTLSITIMAFITAVMGYNEVAIILICGIIGMKSMLLISSGALLKTGTAMGTTTTVASGFTYGKLIWVFLKIGAILFGSGYVLIAYLQGELVDGLGWMTQQQLLDSVAAGQMTPGPVLTTSTFVGYLLGGFPGAVLATLAIFLPSFFFVLILNPILDKLRSSVWASAFLDAVNAAAVAIILAVALTLGYESIGSWKTLLILILAAYAHFKMKMNVIVMILLGGLLGLIFSFI